MKLKNDNGLLIDADTNQCLGYLFDFQGKGVFSPDGKVEIDPAAVTEHNRLLSQGEIQGLDASDIGEHGTFYFVRQRVSTFMGTVVSEHVTVKGKSITFKRNGKTFRGRLQEDADCFNFKRIA